MAGVNAREANAFTDALADVLKGGLRLAAWGQDNGIPEALGLTTDEWTLRRLKGPVLLSQKERRAAVARLTAPVEKGGKGLTVRQTAEALGVPKSTVGDDARTVRNRTPAPEGTPGVSQEAVRNRTPAKSHAQAHEERVEASDQRQHVRMADPRVAAAPFDRIAYGTDALAYLAGLEPACANLCFTSPPYWKKRTYVSGEPLELGQEDRPEDYVARLCAVIEAVGRVLRKDGCLFLNLGDTLASQPGQYRGDPARRRGISHWAVGANGTAPAGREFDVEDKSFLLIPERVVLSLVLEYDWRLAGKVVWHKLGHAPENVYDRLTQAWEPIYVLTRDEHARFLRDPGRDDVWAVPVGQRGEARGHLAPFPDALVERAILHACPEDGVVLDPFAGSGTTMKVAQRLGRRFLGCDLAPQEVAP